MTHLELFAGIGGIALASEWAGFEHVGFVERDPFCQKVLAKHWPHVPIYDDVTTFDGTRFRGVDLISGGFPCQPHSVAGSRKASADERDLWGEVVRIVGEAKPRWFLGENVPGLFSSESGRFFGRVVDDLAQMGYRVGWACYGASDTGAVHRRNRVFIVGYSDQPRLEGCRASRSTSDADATDSASMGRERLSCGESSSCKDSRATKGAGRRLCESCRKDGGDGGLLCGYGQCSRDDSPLLAPDSGHVSDGEADTPTDTIRGERKPHHDFGWGDRGGDESSGAAQLFSNGRGDQCERRISESGNRYCPVRGGDWRQWGISPTVRLEPRIRGGDDGSSNRVDRLKSLGNAVVPQQIYLILAGIAEAIKGERE